jgi:hypothetical protein
MKLFGLGLFLAAFPAQAQQQPADPVEGANVVAVRLADSAAVALKRVVRVLESRGYRVQTCDSIPWRVETKGHQTPADCLVSIQATVLGHSVLLSGNVGYFYRIIILTLYGIGPVGICP